VAPAGIWHPVGTDLGGAVPVDNVLRLGPWQPVLLLQKTPRIGEEPLND
jgi:hypothetical protein